MFSSTGCPQSIFFFMPSSPAMSTAENARYGLQLGSGALNSTLLLAGYPFLYTGTLTMALLFPLLHTTPYEVSCSLAQFCIIISRVIEEVSFLKSLLTNRVFRIPEAYMDVHP